MRLEKINENKLKIIFDSNELIENHISVHSFLSNSVESQKFLLAILEIANEDFGFDSSNSEISYETFSFKNQCFIIFVTKNIPQNTSSFLQISNLPKTTTSNFLRDINTKSNLSDYFVRKNAQNFKNTINKNLSYYSFFQNINDLFDFCNYINSLKIHLNIQSSLYRYNNLFFIETKNILHQSSETNKYFSILSEFQNTYILSENAGQKLKEFSNLLISNNAIQKL